MFTSKTEAIDSLFEYVCKNIQTFVSYNDLVNEDEIRLQENEQYDIFSHEKFFGNEEQYVNGNFDNLKKFCDILGDTYFNQSWAIKIYEF